MNNWNSVITPPREATKLQKTKLHKFDYHDLIHWYSVEDADLQFKLFTKAVERKREAESELEVNS
jgi:hypothetical protein